MVFASQDSRAVLRKYLSDGKIDYDKFFQNEWLEDAYSYITSHNLQFSDESDHFTFWINAYNVLTLKSVQIELTKNPKWNGNSSLFSKLRFFFFRKFQVGDKKLNLYNLENKILRKKFNDPRLHFVINCAAISCPFIPDRLIEKSELEDILELYTNNFINQQGGVHLKDNTLHLSRIFKWYKKDFSEGVITFINKYWKGNQIPNDVRIEHQEYDWSLNKIKS